MTKYVVIVGASSGIAESVARHYAQQGWGLGLLARDPAKLEAIKADLLARGAAMVDTAQADILDKVETGRALGELLPEGRYVDVLLMAAGTLPDQGRCETDSEYAMQQFEINGTAVIRILGNLINRFEQQGGGCIAVISSVAGDRGRPSNYLYGSAKAAISVFLSGARARLFKKGVTVLDIRPGFVATPMTDGLDLPPLLTAHPDNVAADIVAAIEKKKGVLYTPWFWRYILLIIKSIPIFVFKRLSL